MKKTDKKLESIGIQVIVRHIRRENILTDLMSEETIKIKLADFIEHHDLNSTFDELYKEFCKQRLEKSNGGLK